ncbi:hypothetical protein IZY60_00145 [Lutibacter sp. B2]|nr:hypothetical protein [Lutibacter sp. B2]
MLHLEKSNLVIIEKKLKAQMILNEYHLVTPQNGRYSKELLKAKEDFYNRFMSI